MVQTPEEWKIWDIAQDELRSFPEPLPASTMIVGVNQGIVCYLADGKTKLMSAQEKLSDYSGKGEDSVGCLILPFRGASPISYKGCRYWGCLAFRGEKNVCAYIQLRDLKTYKLIHEFQFPEDLPDAPLKEILHGWVVHRFCSASTEYVLFQRGMSNLYCFQFCEKESTLAKQWHLTGTYGNIPMVSDTQGTVFTLQKDLGCEMRDFKTGKLLRSFSLPEKEYKNVYQCELKTVCATDTRHPYMVTDEAGLFKIYDVVSSSAEIPVLTCRIPPDFSWKAAPFLLGNSVIIHGNQFCLCSQNGGLVIDMQTGKIVRQVRFNSKPE